MSNFADALTTATGVAAVAVPFAVQLLKSKFIPVKFQKYPVGTTIGVSIVATVWARWSVLTNLDWHNASVLLTNFLVILLGAALSYRAVYAQSGTFKAVEGDGVTNKKGV